MKPAFIPSPHSPLPAGTYRVDYTGGTMTYDNSDQGYRVNAWNDSNNTDGFEISLNGTIAPTTDHHAPGTDAQETIPTTPFAGVTGQSFTFTPTSTDTIGVYLHDNPYSDNLAYPGDATPTFTLEESVTETKLTATDELSSASASTGSSPSELAYTIDGSGNGTISLSTTTSPTTLPAGYSEFYEIAGAGSPVTGPFTANGSTTVTIPGYMAGSDVTITTGIGPSTGSTYTNVSQTLQAHNANSTATPVTINYNPNGPNTGVTQVTPNNAGFYRITNVALQGVGPAMGDFAQLQDADSNQNNMSYTAVTLTYKGANPNGATRTYIVTLDPIQA